MKCALLLTIVLTTSVAHAEPTLLFLEPQRAPEVAGRLRVQFATELGLALDTHRVERKRVPTEFADETNDVRLAIARDALEKTGADAACWLDVGGGLDVTVAVRRGEHMLSRTISGDDRKGALQELALGTRELLANAYTWEAPVRATEPPTPVEEPSVAARPAPVERFEPRETQVGLVLDLGATGAVGTHREVGVMLLVGLGAQWSYAGGAELRALAEAGHSSGDLVDRTRVAVRVDAGYRVGERELSFVPMAVARVGWLRTSAFDEAFHDPLLQLGVAPELRWHPGSFEIALRPEFAWNIRPLSVRLSSQTRATSADADFAWGGHLLFTKFF